MLMHWRVQVTTVDKYQGQQNDIVLLSLVRTRAVGHVRDVRRYRKLKRSSCSSASCLRPSCRGRCWISLPQMGWRLLPWTTSYTSGATKAGSGTAVPVTREANQQARCCPAVL